MQKDQDRSGAGGLVLGYRVGAFGSDLALKSASVMEAGLLLLPECL